MMTLESPPTTRPPGIRDLPYVKGACEAWARWCSGSRAAGAISMTGRLMMGAGGNVCPEWINDLAHGRGHDPWCPLCHGHGRLPMRLSATSKSVQRVCPRCEGANGPSLARDPRLDPIGENAKAASFTCHRCRGAGTVTVISQWVNPAAIRSTRPADGTGDWQSWMLDDLVTGWRDEDRTFWMNRVVIREYFHNGTQEMKAARLRISESWYKKCLRAAYLDIDRALFDHMPRG